MNNRRTITHNFENNTPPLEGSIFSGVDQIGIYGLSNGSPIGTGTWMNFGSSFRTSISGTSIRVDVRYLFPFGVYTDISPHSASGRLPYLGTVGNNISLLTWTQAFLVLTTNDATNYWRITLKRWSDLATVKEINTSTASASTRSSLSVSSFDISSITTSGLGLYIEVTKVNSPGNLFLGGPSLEVYNT